MTRVNLLPESFVQRRHAARQRRVLAAVAAGLLLTGAAWTAAAAAQLGGLSADIAAAEGALAAARSDSKTVEARRRHSATAAALLDLGAGLELPVPTTAVVALLVRHLPESLVLEELSIQAPAVAVTPPAAPTAGAGPASPKAAGPGATRIDLHGLAVSDVDVANLVAGLSKERLFSNVKLARSHHHTVGEHSRIGFEILLDLRVPSPADPGEAAHRHDKAVTDAR